MAQVIVIHEFGGPETLKLQEANLGDPGPGEIKMRQVAIGVNFADISVREGRFPSKLPITPGSEAAGTVISVGTGVETLKPGDRVAYGASASGGYASEQIVPAAIVAKLRDEIELETAAGMMSAGLTAGYLIRRMWPLKKGDAILFTAAAGGVGQIAVQWAKAVGLTVIGTVGSAEKATTAKEAGCDHVIIHSAEDLAVRVREITGGEGVAAAFDSVGADTLEGSLKSVRKRGLLVSFGAASGPPPAISLIDLAMNGSLFLSRPTVYDYVADPAERASLTEELMDLVIARKIRINVNHRYPLADAAKAHSEMAGRRTTGALVLTA